LQNKEKIKPLKKYFFLSVLYNPNREVTPIWQDKKQGGKLHLHLRRKGRKYRKRGAAIDTRGIIKDRVDISLRPDIVDQKQRFGDLEIDTEYQEKDVWQGWLSDA